MIKPYQQILFPIGTKVRVLCDYRDGCELREQAAIVYSHAQVTGTHEDWFIDNILLFPCGTKIGFANWEIQDVK